MQSQYPPRFNLPFTVRPSASSKSSIGVGGRFRLSVTADRLGVFRTIQSNLCMKSKHSSTDEFLTDILELSNFPRN